MWQIEKSTRQLMIHLEKVNPIPWAVLIVAPGPALSSLSRSLPLSPPPSLSLYPSVAVFVCVCVCVCVCVFLSLSCSLSLSLSLSLALWQTCWKLWVWGIALWVCLVASRLARYPTSRLN